ncbi:MAG: 50S ribosomal protein L4 [Candidatus Omnitrophica bacterium]|nr:50S ribosomal protein L4 [Candidatus Omnitrophota bacterium]
MGKKQVTEKKEKTQKKNLSLTMLNIKGKEVESVELSPLVFDGIVNDALMRQAVVAYLANQRKGLANTKTRGEVRGGGRKPWRQKGTGNARVGSNRSPLWRKGGITFGPRPHSFYKDLPKRMKAYALKSALNAKLKDNEIMVLDALAINSPKTKEFFAIVENLQLANLPSRFVMEQWSDNIKLSSRNIDKVSTGLAKDLTTYSVLNCKKLVFTKDSLKEVEARLLKWLK